MKILKKKSILTEMENTLDKITNKFEMVEFLKR
jgi:hypothetical protein